MVSVRDVKITGPKPALFKSVYRYSFYVDLETNPLPATHTHIWTDFAIEKYTERKSTQFISAWDVSKFLG